MQEGNKCLGMLENVLSGRKMFTLSPVAYITIDFKKLVSDLFHAGFSVVERECIKRNTGLSE